MKDKKNTNTLTAKAPDSFAIEDSAWQNGSTPTLEPAFNTEASHSETC